ncbi:hypothetical protein [Nocardiopsis halophila]|uniref:hypothetical protein n=1 Tax=Nocardiopsis halophila TaxID=141692 RepID=UPI000585C54E|nr:hypothetical protein [Nocardiopsis halophila]
MVEGLRRRRWRGRVGPGDGSALAEYRIWQVSTRSLFFLDTAGPVGGRCVFAVDVRHLVDSTSKREHEAGAGRSPAALYRDGLQVHRSNLPAAFPVPGGVIEVAASPFGLKRMRYVGDDGAEFALRPHPRSLEGLRERLGRRYPRASAVVGAAGFLAAFERASRLRYHWLIDSAAC